MRVPIPLPANMLFKYHFSYLGWWLKRETGSVGVLFFSFFFFLNHDHQKCCFRNNYIKRFKNDQHHIGFLSNSFIYQFKSPKNCSTTVFAKSLFHSELYGVAPWFKSHLGWIKLHRASRAVLKLSFLNFRVMSHISKNKWQSRRYKVSAVSELCKTRPTQYLIK